MTPKVLVADDSLTIQKVIGITLANSGYELIECLNEDDLFRKIQSNQFDLVLLDFNLSDSRSGYELSKQINNIQPSAGIIVMLGTFDTIDESQFANCGILDKIVKPFESSKFIKKCRDILDGNFVKPTLVEEKKLEDDFVVEKDNDLNLWKVDAPQVISQDFYDEVDLSSNLEEEIVDPLKNEIEGWGFENKDSIENKFNKSFPPEIEELSEGSIINRFQNSSSFMDELNIELDEDEDETDPNYEVPQSLQLDLRSQIDEDISADAFWAVDEVVDVQAEEYSDIVGTHLEDVTADLTDAISKFKENESVAASKVISTEETDTIIHMDQDELVEKLKISLRPMVEELVKEFCRQNAEKIAWEIIPDLAENLIRKEIKEIAESVKH